MITSCSAPALTRRLLLASSGNAFLFSSLIAGCSSLLPTPKALPIYVLEPPLSAEPAQTRVNWQLAVAPPHAHASLDTARIALRRMPQILDYYADAAWPDRLPVLIQDLLIGCFVRSGRILGVGRDDSGITANYRLETELANFEAHYDQADSAPQVVVQFDASLVSLPTRTIIARTAVMERVAAMKNNLGDIVMSFNRATAAALEQIVVWTFRELPA